MTAPPVGRRWGQPARVAAIPGIRRVPPAGTPAIEAHVIPRWWAPLAALLATGLAVHAAVAPHFAVRGMPPDVLLAATVAVAAVRGERVGAAFGFATGLGADLFLATPLGTSALAYTLVGHILGGRDDLRHPILLACVGVTAGRLMTAAAATALGGLPFPDPAGLLRILGVAAVSAPLGPPTVALVRRLSRPSGTRR